MIWAVDKISSEFNELVGRPGQLPANVDKNTKNRFYKRQIQV